MFRKKTVEKYIERETVELWRDLVESFSLENSNKENPFIDVKILADNPEKNFVRTIEEYKGISLAYFLHHYDINIFAYTIARKLYEALCFIYSEGFLHRDLHLGNILVFFDEKGELHIRLIDIESVSRINDCGNSEILLELDNIRRIFSILGGSAGNPELFKPYVDSLERQLRNFLEKK